MNAEPCPTEDELLAIVAGAPHFETSHVTSCSHCQKLLQKFRSESSIFRNSSAIIERSMPVPNVSNYPVRIDKFVVVGIWDDNPLFITYRGLHTVVRREILIQVAHEALCSQPNFLEIFRANCTRWMRPKANVTRLLDAGEYQSRPYLVVEFVDGLRLDRLCQQTQMDVATLMRIFEQLSDVLQADATTPYPGLSLTSVVINDDNQAVLVDWAATIEFRPTIEDSTANGAITARRLAKTFCEAVIALDRTLPSEPVEYDTATIREHLISRRVVPAVANTLASLAAETAQTLTAAIDLREVFHDSRSKTIWQRLLKR